MSLTNNAINMKLEDRKKLITLFRKLYRQLDEVIESLYHPGLYTMAEYNKLATQYHILQYKADCTEQRIRLYFPHTDIDAKIKWFKSHPRDSKTADLFNENPDAVWVEEEAFKNLEELEENDKTLNLYDL